MRALLWEIKRLRAMALYVDQLQRMVGTLPGQQEDILEVLRRMLTDEPCVSDNLHSRAVLLPVFTCI